jgi:hypothetical protein
MSEAPPPPFHGETTPIRTGFQFSTATLLGLTTLVAVACALAVTVPGLLGLILAFVVNLAAVAFVGILLAGAWLSSGDRRLFCIVALGCLLIVGTTNVTHKIAWQFYSSRGTGDALQMLAILLMPVELALCSLFGGWIALRTKRFWVTKEPPLSTQDSPPSAVKRNC